MTTEPSDPTRCRMSEITVGCILQDNDPRLFGRRVEVSEINPDTGVITIMSLTNGRKTKLRPRLTRIYTDGKERRSGFSLVGTL